MEKAVAVFSVWGGGGIRAYWGYHWQPSTLADTYSEFGVDGFLGFSCDCHSVCDTWVEAEWGEDLVRDHGDGLLWTFSCPQPPQPPLCQPEEEAHAEDDEL